MPGAVRKLIIYAAVDALVIQPTGQGRQRNGPGIRIDYKSHTIARLRDPVANFDPANRKELKVHGVVGLLDVFSSSWLITISGCRHVAHIFGKPIYVITNIAFIPLSSQQDAEDALVEASEVIKKDDREEFPAPTSPASDGEALESDGEYQTAGEEQEDTEQSLNIHAKNNTEHEVLVDVVGGKGLYGYFVDRWKTRLRYFGSQDQGYNQRDADGSSKSTALDRRKSAASSARSSLVLRHSKEQDGPSDVDTLATHTQTQAWLNATTYLPMLLETTKQLLTSQTFYFSYEYDITNAIHRQRSDTRKAYGLLGTLQTQHVWNGHLLRDFRGSSALEFCVPVMQGYIGQRSFAVKASKPSKDTGESTCGSSSPMGSHAGKDDLLLTLISRRSINRAGFRYLRRGVDEDGTTANSVETEQILSSTDWISAPIHSFVQLRGSIPLFFTQLPYSFKPPPTIYGSPQATQEAFRQHFNKLAVRYGKIHAVSLVDRRGPEVAIGTAYENFANKLKISGGLANNQSLDFTWFDFHQVCSGMKFENVSQLVTTLEPFLTDSKWTSLTSDKPIQRQSGIVRTNCMDCLDRTNVAQSAIGLHMIRRQLGYDSSHEGALLTPPALPSSLSTAFSTLWADNGDAISLAYTHTPALKGDFVRNHKRTAMGALSDLSHTLHRYYRNLFDDFFAQAALDFVLGNVGDEVFAEFAEKGETRDPARDIVRVRNQAVGKSVEALGEEDRDAFINGWVVEVPAASEHGNPLGVTPLLSASNVSPALLRAQRFTPMVLLLTSSAIITASYDWTTDQVRRLSRIPLTKLTRLQRGAYITETYTASQLDATRNIGILISISSDAEAKILPLKAPPRAPGTPPRGLSDHHRRQVQSMSETQQVDQIIDEIARAVRRGCGREVDEIKADIVSAEEARRSTGYAESAKYGLRRIVWG